MSDASPEQRAMEAAEGLEKDVARIQTILGQQVQKAIPLNMVPRVFSLGRKAIKEKKSDEEIKNILITFIATIKT